MAISVTVLLIVVIVVSLAAGGGGDSSSEESGAGAGQPAGSRAGGGGPDYTSFGRQAAPADGHAAASAVRAFLRARAEGDFPKQCSLMAASTKQTLEGFGGGLRERHLPCPRLLESVNSRIRPGAIRQSGPIRVTAVRVDGNRGFVIYRTPDGSRSAFAVARERSAWKVGAINGYPVD